MKGARVARRGLCARVSAFLLVLTTVAPAGVNATVFAGIVGPTRATTWSGGPVDVAVGDFDGDRHLDLVEVLDAGGLAVRWGVKAGEYSDSTPLAADSVSASRVVAADLNADGVDDVAAFTPGARKVWIAASSPEGGLRAVREVAVAHGAADVTVGDFDHDGGNDLAVASVDAAEIVLYLSAADRVSHTTRTVALEERAVAVRSFSLDFDGYADLVAGTTNGRIVTLHGAGDGMAASPAARVEFSPELMAVGDVTADGHDDLVVASRDGAIATLAFSRGSLAEPVVSNTVMRLSEIEVGRVDGDGLADVVATGGGSPLVYSGLGDGRFEAPREAARVADARNVSLIKGTGGVQATMAISRPTGVAVERIAEPVAKLRRAGAVTNCLDEYVTCDGPDEGDDGDVVAAPAGSIRDVVDSGPGVVSFNLLDTSDICFDPFNLVWVIGLSRPLELTGGIQILGETATDTNPFGPDILFSRQQAAEDPDPFTAIIMSGSANIVSSVIISSSATAITYEELPDCMGLPMQNINVGGGFQEGISILGTGNMVRGTWIGTDTRGAANGGVTFAGIQIFGSGNEIGGLDVSDRNVIEGAEGVVIYGDATVANNNDIVGNIIGTDGSIGGVPGGGLQLRGVNVISGDGTLVDSNTIGGASFVGVLATAQANATMVTNNRIGVDRLGGVITGNADGGVVINSSSGATITGNIISGTTGGDAANRGGVHLSGTDGPTTTATIAGNSIVSNATNGVFVSFGDNNDIGPNNTIRSNTLHGVAVAVGTGNTITQNSIGSNGLLGINLVGGNENTTTFVTLNDAGDADAGPNTLLNYPIFTGVSIATGAVVVTGTAPASSVVQIFQSDNDASGFGEGPLFLVQTTATGTGTFTATVPVTLPVADTFALTATATDSGGNTSEFGPNFSLGRAVTVTPTSISFGTVAVGSADTEAVTICNAGLADLTISGVAITPDGSAFTVSPIPTEGMVLSPNECTTVIVTFTPTSEASFAGTLVITTNDPDSPIISVPLSGNAELGSISIDVDEIRWRPTRVGGERTATVNVTNTSNVPVTVVRVEFLRRNSRKVSFATRNDPFFTASPSTFTIDPGATQPVILTFEPKAPLPSPDLNAPFDLPSPAYQTPKSVKVDVRFVVSDSLGIALTAFGLAKVVPVPGITGGGGPPFTDRLDLTLDVYDPDNNLANAQFVFYNESFGELIQLFRIDDTPGVAKATRRFAKGMNVPLTFTFTGLTPFLDSLDFIDAVVIDANGQASNVIRFRVVPVSTKLGGGSYRLEPVSGTTGFSTPRSGLPGIGLEPITVPPRR
jgi:hypothetical protein